MTSLWELLILLFHGYTRGEKHIYYGEAVWIKRWGSRLLQMVVQSTHVNLKDIPDVKMKIKWVMPRISTYKLSVRKSNISHYSQQCIKWWCATIPYLFGALCVRGLAVHAGLQGWYYPNFPLEPIESIWHMMTEDAKRRHLFPRTNIPWFRSFSRDIAICLDFISCDKWNR